ncbi:ParA family protein [Burkholderia vietnamiensis]|uniref:ParA family protein n=1 Tax=Burkholderia vietnamiensis TaxID=60552 RepID=UPI00159438B7|nr:AAA family ATPase [Burkholderia vietnamiensis]
MDINLTTPPIEVTPDDLVNLARRSARMLEKIRTQMLQPFPRKVAPIFPSGKLQELCGIDRARFQYLIKKGELPLGVQEKPNSSRQFTLAETIQWVKAERKPKPRPAGKPGKVITIGNFKGGVTKTTTSMVLAQGLSLRHARRVLHIDMDPQGSATTLYGINPHAEVTSEQTVMPLIEAYANQQSFSLKGLPQKTYWDNLDLIPSSTDLFNAEFMLPARAHQTPGSTFWNVLAAGLEEMRHEYDYIIIDTAPTLSYLTINALFAADGVIVPVMPDTLSFASMVQFWSLFSDMVTGMRQFGESTEQGKVFEFIDILVTRMKSDNSNSNASVVRDWVITTYGERVLPVEIPDTEILRTTTNNFSTIYDFPNYDGNATIFRRVREAYDKVVDLVDSKVSYLWDKD